MVRVAIIGAGASGLPAIKCCLDEGLEPVCFEKTGDIGGLWRYRDVDKNPDVACVFKSTVINTSKERMSYSDFPCPREFPNYMHNSQVWNYYKLYLERFGLGQYIHFNNSVTSVRKASDFATSGRWDVEIRDELTGSMRSETFDAVMVCNGHHADPYVPDFPGLDEFQGQKVHTHYYRTPEGYNDKRVVVIGIGNSGGDAAVELSRCSSQVFLSMRRGIWVIHRIGDGGIPFDLGNNRLGNILPLWLKNYFLAKKLNATLDHKLYGIQPEHEPLCSHGLANDDLPNRLANGTVIVKPNVKRFTETGVEFEDGSIVEDIDVVILATGYKLGFPFLPESVIKVDANRVSLYKYVFPPELECSTLAVIGLIQPWGAINPISELQSRWAARVFSGNTKLPTRACMDGDIAAKRLAMEKRYVKSPRHTIQVDYIDFLDDVATEIGAKPSFSWMMLTDPRLYLKCVLGPCLPYQYRLVGPGKWGGAREAIMTAWDRVEAPLRTRKYDADSPSVLNKAFLFVAMLGIVLWMSMRYYYV